MVMPTLDGIRLSYGKDLPSIKLWVIEVAMAGEELVTLATGSVFIIVPLMGSFRV